MQLSKFLPFFVDSLLGLSFMHKNNIVHRDIKPQNILKLNNQYAISDYGEGIHLNDEQGNEKYEKYCEGEYGLAGTPPFMDPIIYKALVKYKNRRNKRRDDPHPKVTVDLFKTDIYSMGLSLLNAATGQPINSINSSKSKFKECYRRVHELGLPI